MKEMGIFAGDLSYEGVMQLMVPEKKKKKTIDIRLDDSIGDEADSCIEEVPSAAKRAMERAIDVEKELLQAVNDELIAEKESLKEELYRERARVQNILRRTDEEKAEARKYGSFDFSFDLLNVLDCFEKGAQCSQGTPDESIKPFVEGVELTIQEMNRVMRKHGITPIPTDIPYDPDLHQVFECVEADGEKDGTILEVKRKGYILHDRVLRTALVVVAGKPNGGGGSVGENGASGVED